MSNNWILQQFHLLIPTYFLWFPSHVHSRSSQPIRETVCLRKVICCHTESYKNNHMPCGKSWLAGLEASHSHSYPIPTPILHKNHKVKISTGESSSCMHTMLCNFGGYVQFTRVLSMKTAVLLTVCTHWNILSCIITLLHPRKLFGLISYQCRVVTTHKMLRQWLKLTMYHR